MTEKFKQKLESCGFILDNSGRGILYAFNKKPYVLEPNILVQGSHATDIACLHYVDEGDLKGFYYYSSLLEEIAMNFPYEHNLEGIIKKINKYSDTEIKLKSYNGYVFVVTECDETDLNNNTFDYCLSDMLKLIGQLDYFLSRRLEYLIKKETRKSNR